MSADLLGPLLTGSERIYPPAGYSAWWWVVVVACLVGMVAIARWARRMLRVLRPDASDAGVLEQLRAEALARIDGIEHGLLSGEIDAPDAHQLLSGEVRRFVGTVTNGDADYVVLPQLRRAAVKDPRLERVVAFVAAVETPAFAPHAADTHTDTGTDTGTGMAWAFEGAREVVSQWH